MLIREASAERPEGTEELWRAVAHENSLEERHRVSMEWMDCHMLVLEYPDVDTPAEDDIIVATRIAGRRLAGHR